MKAIRKILVAVKNPDARRQPAVDKSIRIAKALGASIEFFHAITEAVFLEISTPHRPFHCRTQARGARTTGRSGLDKLSTRARKLGVEANGLSNGIFRRMKQSSAAIGALPRRI